MKPRKKRAVPAQRTEHMILVMDHHLLPHPSLPGKLVDCLCDLCKYARRSIVGS